MKLNKFYKPLSCHNEYKNTSDNRYFLNSSSNRTIG